MSRAQSCRVACHYVVGFSGQHQMKAAVALVYIPNQILGYWLIGYRVVAPKTSNTIQWDRAADRSPAMTLAPPTGLIGRTPAADWRAALLGAGPDCAAA